MRAVIQKVKKAKVLVGDSIVGEIATGFLVLLAVHVDDEEQEVEKLTEKIIKLRIFADKEGKMNKAIQAVDGEILLVSQFTLYADTKKGNRPSFMEAARPDKAIPFYEKFVEYIRAKGIKIETGEFGAMMEVELTNDGPTTIILDS